MTSTSLTEGVHALGPIVLDVSHHQARVDMALLASSGVVGIIHKSSQGTKYRSKPPDVFRHRQKLAEAEGIAFGSYHYAMCRPGKAAEEAKYYSRFLTGYHDLPPVLDFERELKDQAISKLGKNGAADWINEFIATLRSCSDHDRFMVYPGWYYLTKKIALDRIDWTNVDLWFSYYGAVRTDERSWEEAELICRRVAVKSGTVEKAMARKDRSLPGAPTVSLWQWTDSGKVDGVSGPCDINVADAAWWNDLVRPGVTVTQAQPQQAQGTSMPPQEVINKIAIDNALNEIESEVEGLRKLLL